MTTHESASFKIEPRSSSPLFTRRHLIWSAFCASVASALGPAFSLAQAVRSDLTAAARGEDGFKFLSDPNWKAVFLSDSQNTTLIALGDAILSVTDIPGAKDELVNRYLDLLLSVQLVEFQQKFVTALEFVNAESQKMFGKEFAGLSHEDQVSLLTPWAYAQQPSQWIEQDEKSDPGQRHFGRLKALIAAAYYGSEIGHRELGWDETTMNGPYPGCENLPTDPT